MKTRVIFFLIPFLAGAFAGCSELKDRNPPAIRDLTVNGWSVRDGRVWALSGDSLNFSFTLTDGGLVKSWSVKENGVVLPGGSASGLSTDRLDVSVWYHFQKTSSIQISVKDDDNESASVSFSVTEDPGVKLVESVTLSAQNQVTPGNFVSLITGTVYTHQQVLQNAAGIDAVFYTGLSGLSTLASPADPDAAQIYNNPFTGLPKWSVRNATQFAVSYTNSRSFDQISRAFALSLGWYEQSEKAEPKVAGLAEGSVVSFKTPTGKLGALRVKSVTPGPGGQIVFDIKVVN